MLQVRVNGQFRDGPGKLQRVSGSVEHAATVAMEVDPLDNGWL